MTNTSARRHTKKEKPENRKTLDIQHTQMIDKLNITKNDREQLAIKVAKIDDTIGKLHDQFSKTQDDKVMDKILTLKDERYDVEQKIAALERDNHVEYLLETSDILYKYYEMVDNGGVVENVSAIKPVQNSILNWFSVAPSSYDTEPKESKASIIEKYMQRTCENYINPCSQPENKCVSCGSQNMILIPSEGQIVCNECNCVEHVIIDHEKPSYKDPPKEISYWAYKRINHFNLEWNSGLVSLVMRFARFVF